MNKNREVILYPFIYLNKSWEINRWCQKLNIRADELREVIKRAGPVLDDVLKYIRSKKSGG